MSGEPKRASREAATDTPTDAEVREVTRRVKEHGATERQVTFERLEEFARDVGVRREEVRV